MNNKFLVSVVLSFYNEENVIPELLKQLREALKGYNYELLFINDDSTDNSEKLLRAELKKNKDIVLINMAKNSGVSECVYAGFKHAKGDVVVYMDADLQDPPEVIPKLIEEWKSDEETDLVYTTRKSREGEGFIKMLFTKIGYKIINKISKINLPSNSGDFKLLSRSLVNSVVQNEERFPYIRGIVHLWSQKSKQVFYDRKPRFDGREETKFPFFSKRVWYAFLDRALISFSDFPLKLMFFFGLAISFLSGIYIVIIIIQKILGLHEPGWPAIMATTLFTGGIQLLFLGIVGLYLNVFFLEIKKRPNYIIKNIIDGKEKAPEDKKKS
mgnify:CR=1 FL=1